MNIKTVVESCKEEGLSWREARGILPSLFFNLGQQNPGSELLSKPVEELMQEAERLYAAVND